MSTITTGSLPATYTLHGYEGDSWAQQFRFLRGTSPVDLTSVVIDAAVRSSVDETIDLTVVIIDALDGSFSINAPAGGLAADRYDYDIQLTDAGTITTWLCGVLHIREQVTT